MIEHHLELTQIVESLFEVIKQIPTLFRLHYIINVRFDVPPNLTLQDCVYTFFICSSPVLKPECHLGVIENIKRRNERCFFFIVNGEADLVIAQINIQKQQKFTRRCGIYDLSNTGQRVLVFRTCFIQTSIINTHTPEFVRLFYNNEIC
jgi:hypothetical protein